jgi:hypothetical protein
MKISRTHYNDAGELMAPRTFDVSRLTVTPGGRPTTEAGFYHRFKFEGRTKAELADKTKRFFAEMIALPGYMTLTSREYEVRLDSYLRFGLDVLYAVEAPTDTATPTAQSSATQSSAATTGLAPRR